MNFIGVDLGTSAVKLLLVDDAGAVLCSVSKEYPISFPRPGWSEQDPADWVRATFSGIRELLARAGNGGSRKISGIAVAGQMHGLVALDAEDNVLRPAILWNDGRTIEETDYLNNAVGRRTLSDCTANIAFAGFTAPKILWMRKREPELFARIAKVMLPKDYINYVLTGVFATDVSDASGTLLFDVRRRRWSARMLEICGLRESQLAQVFESCAPIGRVRREAAQELGLGDGVVVAAGAGDNAAAAIGTGAIGEGSCNISVGTSGTIFIPSRNCVVDGNNALHSFAHADGNFHLMGCMLSAASCNKWWCEDVLGSGDYAAMQRGIAADRLGRNRVYFMPYLMGERSPHNDPLARGAFVGMRMDTSRADMTQAVLEGVAFGMRDSLEVARSLGIEIARSKICGGGARSGLWREIFASVLGIAIDVVATEEGPGYGGAMLAAVACGRFATVAEAAGEFVRVVETVEPAPDVSARYEERYGVFRRLYPAMKPLFALDG